MTIELKMPALSPTMEEGTLAKWLVKEGDEIQAGDIIAEIETDKATMEFEAVDEGTVDKLLVGEGTEGIKVGTVIATISGESKQDSDDTTEAPSPSLDTGQAEKSELHKPKTPAVQVETKPVTNPDIPEGTTFAKLAVREALRDAMAEEMRRDDRVFRGPTR